MLITLVTLLACCACELVRDQLYYPSHFWLVIAWPNFLFGVLSWVIDTSCKQQYSLPIWPCPLVSQLNAMLTSYNNYPNLVSDESMKTPSILSREENVILWSRSLFILHILKTSNARVGEMEHPYLIPVPFFSSDCASSSPIGCYKDRYSRTIDPSLRFRIGGSFVHWTIFFSP